MSNNDHIESSLDKIRQVFIRASNIIESLSGEEKIAATKLAADLAPEFDTTGPALYPTIKYLLDGYPGFEVTKGAKGGIRRKKITTTPSEENK